MLAGDFFVVASFKQEEAIIRAALELNTDHAIFAGHFPEQPVVPGVCMLQMTKELLEKALGSPTRLIKADNLKFLSLIDPRVNQRIQAEIKYEAGADGNIKVSATLFNEGVVYFKMNGHFSIEQQPA